MPSLRSALGGAIPRRVGRWLIVLALAPLATACANGHDVATLLDRSPSGGQLAETEDPVAQQQRAAAALVECLAGLGVKANTSEPETSGAARGFVTVIPVLEGPSFLIVTPEGAAMSTEDYPEDAMESASPRLVDGDRDLTEEYVACIESSGYFVPEEDYEIDPREEEISKQQEAEAGIIWAECARANGFPTIKDPEVILDGFTTRPEVLIPESVTPDQFKALLKDCPPFDPTRDLAHGNTYEADEEMPTDPVIGFDLPAGGPLRLQLERILDDFIVQAYEEARASS
jgi:hypothetical protein